MRLSQYYLPTLKEAQASATIISHQYSLRAGLIKATASGIYTWLPLGLKVLQKIQDIIRDEMNKAGSLEILMPSIQPASLWQESGRYDDYGPEMLRIKDRHQRDMLFGPTHEEVITDVIRGTLNSYKDLPKCFYQIQWKFRDEIRPRFGVMRGREFLMKDAYSFDCSVEASKEAYKLMYQTYIKIFKRLNLTPVAIKAATGPIGGNLSHEFHVLAGTGESTLYYDKNFLTTLQSTDDFDTLNNIYTAADEMHDPQKCPIPEQYLNTSKGIEIGHIFHFGDKYSQPMKAMFNNIQGKNLPIQMGSYGIGVSRLVGAIIEAFHDEKGIIWPKPIAPFKYALINLNINDNNCCNFSDKIYNTLTDVLYDDTNNSAGVKIANMNLIGIPIQIIIGKSYIKNNKVEVKDRASNTTVEIDPDSLINYLQSI